MIMKITLKKGREGSKCFIEYMSENIKYYKYLSFTKILF